MMPPKRRRNPSKKAVGESRPTKKQKKTSLEKNQVSTSTALDQNSSLSEQRNIQNSNSSTADCVTFRPSNQAINVTSQTERHTDTHEVGHASVQPTLQQNYNQNVTSGYNHNEERSQQNQIHVQPERSFPRAESESGTFPVIQQPCPSTSRHTAVNEPNHALNTGQTQLYSLGSSPIIVDAVKQDLACYPNQDMALELIHGLEHGFSLKYSGPRLPVEIHSKAIVGERATVARIKINKEIKLGRIAGPFDTPPFRTFRVSPIAVVPKKSSPEYRLIHNLSFPPNGSVNDFVDKEYCSVKYSSIDDAVKMIQNLGEKSLLAKYDVKSAVRLLRLSPSEFDLTGFKFENKYYFDKNLLMGASVSCKLFESFSTALHWFVENKAKNDNILHYLDDFLFGGPAESTVCMDTLTIFKESCNKWGVSLAHEKTIEPTEVLVFLGIEFDTINLVMRLPGEKLQELKERIISCLNSSKITLRELQSLIGVLNFACQVIVPGRAFCRRLIDATCNLSKPNHKTRITRGMKDDLKIWLMFLSNYNGSTVMLDKFWSLDSDLELFTDSAAGEGKGFGIYFEGQWAQANWPNCWETTDFQSDITFLKLFPVVVALNIWGVCLQNKKILFHIDNQAVVAIINKKSSKSPRVMSLVRKMVFACLEFNILVKAEHIPGRMNLLADSLSRSDFQKFRRLCPTAASKPCTIPPHLWKL